MTSSLIRRLVLAALALVALTLLAVYSTLTTYSVQVAGAAVDPAVRTRVLEISLAAALLALVVGLLVSRSLTSRVRGLKRAAEGLLGAEAERGATWDSGDDLGSLERSLGGVGRELRTLVSNLRFESARREAILAGMA
jgi:methyl-accepting chemotaxis protein